MYALKFFEKAPGFNEQNFRDKLKEAINLISQNQTLIAKRTLEIIATNKVTIQSFFELSQDHYLFLRKDILEESHIRLPNRFPMGDLAVRMIESNLTGIIFNDRTMYINSMLCIDEMAKTLIHEISHHMNQDVFHLDKKATSHNSACYKEEIRAFTAEKIFEKNGHCILRSDVKKIHAKVAQLYPELNDPLERTTGYIPTNY